MDCRKTQPQLTAFHDGELPDANRVRVEEHLRGCPGCRALLADLARADEAAGVPDPGPGYWDRFNTRLEDRIEREAEGPRVAVLRPKQGWMRQQLRFFVPAVAAAALVVVVVRYGGLNPGAPTPTIPQAVSEPAGPDSAGQRVAKAKLEPPATEKKVGAAAARRAPAESSRAAEVPAAPPPSMTYRSAPAGSPQVTETDGIHSRAQVEQKNMEGAAAPATELQLAAKAESASGLMIEKDQSVAEAPSAMSVGKARAKADPSPPTSDSRRSASPCELARTLAAQGRLREAEAAQRACLAQDQSAPTQEKGLIFLAELLDRQSRFAEADSVITEVDRQFPQSRPLDLYRRQRPMVQKQLVPVPSIR